MIISAVMTFVVLLMVVGLNPHDSNDASAIGHITKKTVPGDQYEAKGDLLTSAEKHFMKTLQHVADHLNLSIAMKVRAADLVEPRKTLVKKDWWKRFRFLSQKHIDFVLLNHEMTPVLGIELNDKSHLEGKRVERDVALMAIFYNARLPLIFIPASREYDEKNIAMAVVSEITRYA